MAPSAEGGPGEVDDVDAVGFCDVLAVFAFGRVSVRLITDARSGSPVCQRSTYDPLIDDAGDVLFHEDETGTAFPELEEGIGVAVLREAIGLLAQTDGVSVRVDPDGERFGGEGAGAEAICASLDGGEDPALQR